MSRYQISTNTYLPDSEEVEELDAKSVDGLGEIVRGMVDEAIGSKIESEKWYLDWLKSNGYRVSIDINTLSIYTYAHGPNESLLRKLLPRPVVNLTLEYRIKKPVQEGAYNTIHSIRVDEEIAYLYTDENANFKGVIYTGKINDIVQFFKEYLFKLSQGD
uniref:Uncharacterized protein n=1 Tax=Myoviridae sp. ctLnO19 TaxID=2825085 RepID=A0A8S5P0W6_9CAUD|nr:MAG TPA: hypothetical protein [Myoviridae sp. ctLnO19]DAJ69014.1 MAG TPA: hypothetical protein [Caudoviricetes sp.]